MFKKGTEIFYGRRTLGFERVSGNYIILTKSYYLKDESEQPLI